MTGGVLGTLQQGSVVPETKETGIQTGTERVVFRSWFAIVPFWGGVCLLALLDLGMWQSGDITGWVGAAITAYLLFWVWLLWRVARIRVEADASGIRVGDVFGRPACYRWDEILRFEKTTAVLMTWSFCVLIDGRRVLLRGLSGEWAWASGWDWTPSSRHVRRLNALLARHRAQATGSGDETEPTGSS